MTEIRDLYQEVILDHSKRPRNLRKPDGTNKSARGYNALCGDRITVYLRVAGEVVEDLGFEGSGCAICTASASVMTEILKGKATPEVERLFQGFHALVTGTGDSASATGKLQVFAGVSEFPARVKCASLPWHTMHAALEDQQDQVSTE